MTKKKTKHSGAKKMGALAGLAAVAAGVAYLLTGEQGEKNRKKIETFVTKVRKDIESQIKTAKKKANVTKKEYEEIVENAIEKYGKNIKEVDQKDLKAAARELKKGWAEAKRTLLHEEETAESAAPAKKRAAKKVVRKPAKKTAKKTAKKKETEEE